MKHTNPLPHGGMVFVLFICASVLFTTSACQLRTLFLGRDLDRIAAGNVTLQSVVYSGTFTPGEGVWRVTESQVQISIDPEDDTVTGTGMQVNVKDPADATDYAESITYIFEFQGTYYPAWQSIQGTVHITGGRVCTANCGTSQNYDLDFSANWTASLSDDARTIWGHVDQMGNYGDFTANK